LASFAVVLDANVLYPFALRDLFVELSISGLYKALWTDAIHDEWTRNLLKDRPDLDPAKLARTRALMDASGLDSRVEGYEPYIPVVRLPDPDDRHVVAAAIHSRADAIVTFNLKDFPAEDLAHHGLEAIHPDDFMAAQFDLDEAAVLTAAQQCIRRWRNPPVTPEEWLDILERNGMTKTVARLRAFAAVLG
jgi:predicted nucleic acid-binding protein